MKDYACNYRNSYSLLNVKDSQDLILDHNIRIHEGRTYVNKNNIPIKTPKDNTLEKLCCIFYYELVYEEESQMLLIHKITNESKDIFKKIRENTKEYKFQWKVLEFLLAKEKKIIKEKIINESRKENLGTSFDESEIFNML